jgi:polyphosphate kinase 2 (PPK2 family)
VTAADEDGVPTAGGELGDRGGQRHLSERRLGVGLRHALTLSALARRARGGDDGHMEKLPRKVYEEELLRLQTDLVAMTDWIKREGARVALVFEGRDAAGKGGVIKRITQHLSTRIAPVVALPAPTEHEQGE